MDLQFDQLRAFVAVIDQGTFEGAARELRITPSAVSQRVKALEIGVGRVLLQRQKPVSVTGSGEAVLRLARQLDLLERDALAALGDDETRVTSIPLVVNADSLAIWVLPALAEMLTTHGLSFDVYREDQDHSTELLRNGTVMAAITSVSAPVQGCLVRPLGRMRYRPMANPEFVKRWFPNGATVDSLAVAPVVVFDRKDDLQDRYLRRRTRRTLHPPRTFIPASTEFARSVELGLGWGMLPGAQSESQESAGNLVAFDPAGFIDVPLYWQQWKLHSPLLSAVADAVEAAAVERLS